MRTVFIIICTLATLLSAGAVPAGEHETHSGAPADPRFEFLKGLAGTWIGEAHHEGAPPSRFEFRVTAGGHAVEELEMAGTPMEMLTVYHMAGRDLVATHYCMLGNQPRVVAAKRVVDNSLTFDCAGTPGNATSHDEEHIHGWTLRLDGDTMHYTASMLKDGEQTEAPTFVLSR